MRLQQLEDDHFRFPDLNGALYFFIKNPAALFSDRRKRAAGFYSTFGRWYVIMCMTQLHRKERGDGLNFALTAFVDRSIFLSYIIAY